METEDGVQVWKLVLAYDGTEFHGWQVQPGQPTIQGELRAAIERVSGEDVLPQGSGRTDAGVHALAQVVSFALAAPIPERSLARALNRTLPATIRVLAAGHAPQGFHARHSSRGKTYEYRIFRGEICPPFLARYAYALNHPLDLRAMQSAAEQVLGAHDFTSFAAGDPDRAGRGLASAGAGEAALQAESGREPPGNVRTIDRSEWTAGDGEDLLRYRVRGNGFLHHMVRNLVGTFLEVGRGNLEPEAIPKIIEGRARAGAGPTAPARGLFLVEVEY